MQAVHLFVVAYSLTAQDLVTVSCDGCGTTIDHGARWYRNMELEEDLDLCTNCFTSESVSDLCTPVLLTLLSICRGHRGET